MYVFLCLVYFIFGLFWFYKFIIYYAGLSLYQKLVSVIIPVIIFECLIELQIYTEINNSGSVGKIFIIFSIISLLVKNIIIRIIMYGLSIGYLTITRVLSKKKLVKFGILLIGYVVFETTFQILYESYKSNLISFAYILLSSFFLLSINAWIFYKIYKGIRHYFEYGTFHEDVLNASLYGSLKKIMLISAISMCVWLIFEFSFSVTNNDTFWYAQWLGNYFLEIIYVFFYLTIFVVLIPKLETQKEFGYQVEIDEDEVKNKSTIKDSNYA